MGTFVLGKQTDGQFYWKLNAANGETLCVSEGYTTKLPTKRGNNLS